MNQQTREVIARSKRRPEKIFLTPIGYPCWVKVSTDGDVFLEERTVSRGINKMRLKAQILKQKEWQGYRLVQFRINGKNKCHKVHRLVLMAHSGSDGIGLDANHKNGIRDDNRIENLEWCTRSFNLKHSYCSNGRVGYWKGKESTNKGKFNNPGVSRNIIGVNVKTGAEVMFLSAAEAGRNGFSRDGVAHCLIGNQKSSGGFVWSYADVR